VLPSEVVLVKDGVLPDDLERIIKKWAGGAHFVASVKPPK